MGKLSDIPQIYIRIYDWIMVPADRLGIRKWRKWATSLQHPKIPEVGVGAGLNMPYWNYSFTQGVKLYTIAKRAGEEIA